MRVLKAAAVSLLCAQLGGCFFVFIPGSVVGKISDGITGAEGEHCVGRDAVVGSRIRNPANGEILVVKSLSGTTSRCTDQRYPIRAAMVPETATAPALTQQNLTACRDWDRANRKGTFSEEQAEKRKLVDLNLNEADCKALIATADR